MVKIIVNKEFANRADLDDFVRTRFGTNPEANAMHSIEGTPADLATLGLSEDSTVFGVRIVQTSIPIDPAAPVGFANPT